MSGTDMKPGNGFKCLEQFMIKVVFYFKSVGRDIHLRVLEQVDGHSRNKVRSTLHTHFEPKGPKI